MTRKFFRGHHNLKAKNVNIEWTEELIQEYIKCEEDVYYFIETYYKIVTEDGIAPMILRDYQREMIDSMLNNRFTLAVWSRQSGKSETFRAFLCWYILFNEWKTVALVANKETSAIELINKIQISYQHLPTWLQQGIVDFNKGSFVLENGCRLFASSTSKDSLRSYTVHIIVVDEAAHIDDWKSFYSAISPTIAAGKRTKMIMSSCVTDNTLIYTPDGVKTLKNFIDYTKIDDPKHAYLVNKYSVLGYDKINNGTYIMNSGLAPTKKIKLQHSEIECSLPHKLYAYKNGKYDWVKAENLSIDDYVALQYGMNIWGFNDDISNIKINYWKTYNKFIPPKIINKELAYFLGLYLAEGWTDKIQERTVITCEDDIKYALTPLNLNYSCNDGIHYVISSKSLKSFIEQLGFDITLKAKNKIIPERILEMSSDIISSFISGFVDGDGSISKTKEIISITSASEKLINQLQVLLLNFGILSVKRYSLTKPTKKVIKYCDCYTLEISNKHYYKFNELIGFKLPRKTKLMKIKQNKRNDSSQDIIPDAVQLLKNNNIKYSLSGQHKNQINLSRQFCLSLNNIDKLSEIISPNRIWSKVKKIENSENKVYDFSLDDIENDKWCHSVIYNGIIGHQTPRGLNHFYEFYQGSQLGDNTNGYHAIFVPWQKVPGRDQKWYDKELARNNYDSIFMNQEYSCILWNTLITIKNMETREIKNITIEEAYNLL